MNRAQAAGAAALGVIALIATVCLPGAFGAGGDGDRDSYDYIGHPLPGLDVDAVIAAAQQAMPGAETRQSSSSPEDTIIDNDDSTDPLLSGSIRVTRGPDNTVTDVTCDVTSEHGEQSPIIAVCIDLPVDGADPAALRATMQQLFVSAPVGSSTSVRYPQATWYFDVDQYGPVVKDYWVSVSGRSA